MASNEERLDALEEKAATQAETLTQTRAIAQSMFGIVKEMSQKQDEMLGAVRSIQAHQAIVDGRLDTMDGRLNILDARLSAMQRDTENRFAQVATKQDIAESTSLIEKVLRDLLTLNAKQSDVMVQVLVKLGEQTEKQGE